MAVINLKENRMTIRIQSINKTDNKVDGNVVFDTEDNKVRLIKYKGDVEVENMHHVSGTSLIKQLGSDAPAFSIEHKESKKISSSDELTVSLLLSDKMNFSLYFPQGYLLKVFIVNTFRPRLFSLLYAAFDERSIEDEFIKGPASVTVDSFILNQSELDNNELRFSITLDFKNKNLERYINDKSLGSQKIRVLGGKEPVRQRLPKNSTNSIGYATIRGGVADLQIHNKILNINEIKQQSNHPTLMESDLITFANNNNIKDSNNIISDLSDISLDKFIKSDFTSSSAIAALNTTGLAKPNRVLKQVRALQRLLLTGLALGPDSNNLINFGNRLQLKEAFYLLAANYYSASSLAIAKEDNIRKLLEAAGTVFPSADDSDDDDTKFAKARANNRPKLLIASARQRAHLVSLAYLNAKDLSSPALAAANRGDESQLSFENQFNSSEYYEVPAERSAYSTSAYLVALRELMDEHVNLPSDMTSSSNLLSQRRPDLDDIVLTPENALELQPKLKIVNKVLKYHARSDKSSDLSLTDAEQDTINFPLNYPFNVSFDKVQNSLQSIDTSTYEINQVLGGKLSRVWDIDISPSMVEIVATDPEYSDKAIPASAADIDSFEEWGFEDQAELEGAGNSKVDALNNVSEFLKRADLKEEQLHSLLFADLSISEIAEDKHLALYFNQKISGFEIDATKSLNISSDRNQIENLDKLRQDRIHRFLRLSKASGLDIVELHRLLRTTGNRINKQFIRIISSYQRIKAQFDLTLDQFSGLIGNLRTEGKGNGALELLTPLQVVFYREEQNIPLFDNQKQLNAITWDRDSTPLSQEIKAELSARLNVSESQLNEFSKIVQPSGGMELSLANLSALYRVTLLAKLLNVNARQLIKMFDSLPEKNMLQALTSNSSLVDDKLNVIESLLFYIDEFEKVNLSLITAHDLSSTSNRLNVQNTKFSNFNVQIERSLEETPKESLSSFNDRLKDANAEQLILNSEQFNSIFTDGIVTEPSADILTEKLKNKFVVGPVTVEFTEQQRDQQVIQFKRVLADVNSSQMVLFETTLVDSFGVNSKYAREFTAWAGEIISNPENVRVTRDALLSSTPAVATSLLPSTTKPANSPSIEQRLSGNNNDLRTALLSDWHTSIRKRNYQNLRQLAKIVNEFDFEVEPLQQILKTPAVIRGFNSNELPSPEALLGVKRFKLALESLDIEEPMIIESIFANTGDSQEVRQSIATKIAEELDDAEQSEILPLIKHFASLNASYSRPYYRTLNGFADILLSYQFSRKNRLQPACMLDIANLGTAKLTSYSEVLSLAKAVSTSLSEDEKRNGKQKGLELEKERNRLLPLALHLMKKRNLPVDTPNELYRYLLLDVLVGGEATTSPVIEATLALQLHGELLLNNQEKDHSVTETFREYWEWMKSYPTWQANRKVFFETENYLLPELRKDKSETFKMLENKISQAINNPELAETVFKEFAADLLSTMNLEIVGIARSVVADRPDAIVARTKLGSSRDVYIRFTNLNGNEENSIPYLGGEWQKLSIPFTDNDSQSISPVFAFGKWHLFWVNYQETGRDVNQNVLLKAKLNRISLEANNNWKGPEVLMERFVGPNRSKDVNKLSSRYVTAQPPSVFNVNGSEEQLNKVQNIVDSYHKDILDGEDVLDTIIKHIKPKTAGGDPGVGHGITMNRPLMLELIVHYSNLRNPNREDENEERRKLPFSFDANVLHIDRPSAYKDARTAANDSKSRTEIDGIVLTLPGVFGLSPEGMLDLTKTELPTTYDKAGAPRAFPKLTSNGIAYFESNGESLNSTDTVVNENFNIDTFVLSADGKLRSLTGLKISPIKSIIVPSGTNSNLLYRGLGFYETSNLTSSSSTRLKPATTAINDVYFGDVNSQQLVYQRGSNRYIRIDSKAAETLLGRLSMMKLADFMHHSSQKLLERSFVSLQPEKQITLPWPSERISFNDFNGQAYRELFFHAPMLIATVLKKAQRYEEATRWYKFIFNPSVDTKKLMLENDDLSSFKNAFTNRNSYWQSEFLRRGAPSKFIGELYIINPAERNGYYQNILSFFRDKRIGRPLIKFKVPEFNYSSPASSGNISDWITNDDDSKYASRLIREASPDERDNSLYPIPGTGPYKNRTFENIAIHYHGTQFLSQGNYYLQFLVDDDFAIILNGDLIFKTRQNGLGVINVPVNIRRSGIQQLEFLYLQGGHGAEFKVKLASALPNVNLEQRYLLNDTATVKAEKTKEKLLDFKLLTSQEEAEQKLLSEINSIDDLQARQQYIKDPFNPHALASIKPAAYRVWVFYEFVDNELQKADKLFKRRRREDLDDALLIYTRLQTLLGDAPNSKGVLTNMPSPASVSKVRKAGLLDFDGDGDADIDDADIQGRRLVDSMSGRLQTSMELLLEHRLSMVTTNGTLAVLDAKSYDGTDATAIQLQPRELRISSNGESVELVNLTSTPRFTPQNYLNNSYFAIPINEKTLQLWSTLENRLFNLRNGRDINGNHLNLPLTPELISPLQLAARSNQAATLGQTRGGASVSVPHHRFNYAIARAKEVAQMANSFGSRLLSILEKKDATELEALRAAHEQSVLEMNVKVLQQQMNSVRQGLQIFHRQYETARYLEYRYTGLQNINVSGLATSNADYQDLTKTKIDLGNADDSSDIRSVRGDSGSELYPGNTEENASQGLKAVKTGLDTIYSTIDGIVSAFDTAPNIFGFAVGGFKLSAVPKGLLKVAKATTSDLLGYFSEVSGELASRRRRKAGWEENRQLQIMDQAELKDKIRQHGFDLLAVMQQYDNLQAEVRSNNEIEQFIKSERRTKTELYNWLSNRMMALYFQSYQLAVQLALEAEKTFNFELGDNQSFVKGDYWDSSQEGLLAGEGVLLTLQRMQHAYDQANKRKLQITKFVSLHHNTDVDSSNGEFKVTENGTNLLSLLKDPKNKSRSIEFELPSKLFARDFPGHYMRLIRTVSITIPAVVGPYQSLSATLKQVSNRALIEDNPDSAKNLVTRSGLLVSVRKDVRANQAIAVSSAVNDSGQFQLNFNDNRYLPFENTGADSSWVLEFSPGIPEKVFQSITDVIIEVKYTAEEGSEQLRSEVVSVL